MSRDRYRLCGDDCTTDCGACKGAGRPMTTELSPAEEATLARIEAAPAAEESLRERVARALYDSTTKKSEWDLMSEFAVEWDETSSHNHRLFRRLADAAIAVMRGVSNAAKEDEACRICGFGRDEHEGDGQMIHGFVAPQDAAS